MMKLIHGGDIAGFEEEYGCKPLDFSANINPFGLPEGVKRAVMAALEEADAYPDPLCRKLTAALAEHEHFPAGQILCGNGAADLIFRLVLAQKPRTALLPAPTFAEYEQALALVGCRTEHHILLEEDSFCVTRRFAQELQKGYDITFLCNPNNPTGQTIEPQLMREILAICRENHTLLVVDECFNSFLEEPERHSLARAAAQEPQLFLLKAFTKLYGMAGIRLGYGLAGSARLIEAMRHCGQPWEVSSLAQAAGLAALKETAYVAKTKELLRGQRAKMKRELAAMGLTVFDSQANYIFFRCELPDLPQKMRQKGVLIRSCGNYIGLDERYYRVAVRSEKENDRLLQRMRQVFEENQ